MILFLRSVSFYIGQIVCTILIAPIGIIAFPLDFKKRYYLISQWAVFNLWWLKICCNIRYKVEGRRNIPDEPCIVMCKHQSAFETLALQRIFIPQVWILKKELFSKTSFNLRVLEIFWGFCPLAPKYGAPRGAPRGLHRSSPAGAQLQLESSGCPKS